MAISVAYGLFFGTTLTLLLLPALLVILNASKRLVYRFLKSRSFTQEDVEPAIREELFAREQSAGPCEE